MLRKLIDRPIAVTMTLIAVIVLGIVAANLLPVSLMPDVAIPNITVQLSAPGYSSRQVDVGVVAPLRGQLMQVAHLKEIRSESRDDAASIYMQFEYGADIDFLFIEVNEKIDRAMSRLPHNIERPRVIKASATDIPAFYLNISLKEGHSSEASPRFMELSELVTQVVAKRIEQIPEVAMVDASGMVYPEILIVPKQEKMDALGIGLAQIEAAISNNNITLGNLTIRDGEYRYSIRFENRLRDREDLENLILNIEDRLYRLSDLADLIEQPQPRRGVVRSRGDNAITLAVIKQSDARLKELKGAMSSLIGHMEQDYPDLQLELTRDQTALLQYSIGNLKSNIVLAAILASLVLFIFMADFRSPLLIAITIPLSLLISFLFLYLVGVTINIISLSGLILCVGMMVDNSIIVIDNITQHWERGVSHSEASSRGAGEVFSAMLSSALTTISVFVPLIFLSGIAGALFYDQAMAVSIGLLVSLAVAVLVIPVYYRLFYQKFEKPPITPFLSKIDLSGRMAALHKKMIRWVFRHRSWMWALFIAVIPLALILFRTIEKERLPQITRDDLLLYVDWNEMLSVEESDSRMAKLIELVDPLITESTLMVGEQHFMLSHTSDITSSEAIAYIRGENPDNVPEIEELITNFLEREYGAATHRFEASGNIFDMLFSDQEAPLIARLRQSDGEVPSPDNLNQILATLSNSIPDVQFEPVLWSEHLLLSADPQLMSLYKIERGELFTTLKNRVDQNLLFTIKEGAIPIPVVSGENRQQSDILEGSVMSSDSVSIPLRTVLVESRSRDLKSVVAGSEGNYYPLPLHPSAKETAQLMSKIRGIIGEEDSFEVDFSGSYFSNRSMIKELILVLMVSLLLLYFILSAQFESIVQPLIILSEIIMDICGALLLLLLFGATLNLMALIGIVVMSGIAINDSILQVDTINRLRKEGYSLLRAILTAGEQRLKPIVMTSLTTILALVPFLAGGNMGADLQYPLSLALIGGMIIGTLASIFFIPIAYYQIYKGKE